MPIYPGENIHLGVPSLYHLLSEAGTISSADILIQFFVDGLSISKSTKFEVWIIMMNIRQAIKQRLRLVPKVIGVYLGEKKPANFNEFLWPFVMELLDLLQHGIEFKNVVLKLKILNFVLDAKARCYCKQVNGYLGCDVCVEEGDHIDNRMTFLNMNAPVRNDADYRARVFDDQDYHKMESVLELLPIDMINAFPPDYLHCVRLGVERWILEYIRHTPKMLSSKDYATIKRRVDIFRNTQPTEFQRNLRSFDDNLGTMKGTEFRQHLLLLRHCF